MSQATETADWDPTSEAVRENQIAACDAMRQRCPVAHSERAVFPASGFSTLSVRFQK